MSRGCPGKRFFRSENIPFEPDPGNAGVGITEDFTAVLAALELHTRFLH